MESIKLPIRPTTAAVREFIAVIAPTPIGWSDVITPHLANELTPLIRQKYIPEIASDQLAGRSLIDACIMIQHLIEEQQVPVPREVLDDVVRITEEVTGIAEGQLGAEDSFVDDLDTCSMDMVDIVYQLEDRQGVKIPREKILALPTIGHIAAYVTRQKQPVG